MRKNFVSVLIVVIFLPFLFITCTQLAKEEKKIVKAPKKRKAPVNKSYQFIKPKAWVDSNATALSDTKKRQIILAVNRIDNAHFLKLDSALLPSDLSGDIEYYLPFPFTMPGLADIDKIIFFSYPTQSFGAYENGELIYAGPTNMGRKNDPTPTGLFYTHWKAEQTTSTFNDEWDLRWNFNIENKLGVGWHQYEMPGYPASHSCLRLQEWDAKYLYKWADQWVVDEKENIQLQGTPVIVFGAYNFNGKKPWLSLVADPSTLAIEPAQLEALAIPFLSEIKGWQAKRVKAKK